MGFSNRTAKLAHAVRASVFGRKQKLKGKAVSAPGSYGTIQPTSSVSAARNSTEVTVESLARVPEDEGPLAFSLGLEEGGVGWDDNNLVDDTGIPVDKLSTRRYTRIVQLYSLVPLCAILAFVILAFLPLLLWPHPHSTPSDILRIVSIVVVAAALWSLSHTLRVPMYKLSTILSFCCTTPTLTICLSTLLSVFLQELLRVSAFIILNIYSRTYPISFMDPAFTEIWTIALGWAFAEVATGTMQGFDQIQLYRDVLSPVLLDRSEALPEGLEHTAPLDRRRPPSNPSGIHSNLNNQIGDEVPEELYISMSSASDGDTYGADYLNSDLDTELSRLVNMKARAELEEVYGIPFVDIPVFVLVLQRIDSILLSLGWTLLLSFGYLQTQRALQELSHYTTRCNTSLCPFEARRLPSVPADGNIHSLWTTFLVVLVLHYLLSMLHTSLILSRIGVHTAAYISLLVGLGVVFAGLALWGALS